MIAHTLGNPFDLATIARFCEDHDLFLIEDCCDAVGATYGGQHVGSFGEFATVSFYPAHHRVKTSEDSVVSKVGRDLYEKFFRGYIRKQWELDPSELHASVTARIPIRFNDDDRDFNNVGGWLHRDVRASARPSQHRGAHGGRVRGRASLNQWLCH